MIAIDQGVIDEVNRPGRIGVLSTANRKGEPNVAYVGSGRVLSEGGFILSLGNNRSLENLEQNPNAVFLVIKESPVNFKTQGWRLYLKVQKIHREGELLDSMRKNIARRAGPEVAATIKAAVVLEILEVRPLITSFR